MSIASLLTTLAPIQEYLDKPEIAEISINRPNELWLDDGVRQQRIELDLPLKRLERLSDLVASFSAQQLSDKNPLLSAVLPNGNRIQLIISPVTRVIDLLNGHQDTVSVSIRKPTVKDMSLSSWQEAGAFNRIGVDARLESEDLARLKAAKAKGDYYGLLTHAIKTHKTILILGGTYSGKTTVLNMLLKEIDKNERIITIEDHTPELIIENPNHVRLFYSRGNQGVADITAKTLITATLRMRPDRIIMGELRDELDVTAWLNAANSGHEGTMATLHSDSPHMAIEKMVNMIETIYPNKPSQAIRRYILSIIDVILQIKRCPKTGARYISALMLTSEYDHGL